MVEEVSFDRTQWNYYVARVAGFDWNGWNSEIVQGIEEVFES